MKFSGAKSVNLRHQLIKKNKKAEEQMTHYTNNTENNIHTDQKIAHD